MDIECTGSFLLLIYFVTRAIYYIYKFYCSQSGKIIYSSLEKSVNDATARHDFKNILCKIKQKEEGLVIITFLSTRRQVSNYISL